MWLLILYILSAGHKDQVTLQRTDTFAQCGQGVDKLLATGLLDNSKIKLSCEQEKLDTQSTYSLGVPLHEHSNNNPHTDSWSDGRISTDDGCYHWRNGQCVGRKVTN